MIKSFAIATFAAIAAVSLTAVAQAEDFPATPMNPGPPMMMPMTPMAEPMAPMATDAGMDHPMAKPMTMRQKRMMMRKKKMMMMEQGAAQ